VSSAVCGRTGIARRAALEVLLLASAALPAARGGAADWPQWRGPNRNGTSPETGWRTAWPADGPKALWRNEVGVGFSSIAVRGGKVYTLGSKQNVDTVYCFDADTGQKVWEHSYACVAGKGESGPRATPALDGKFLYSVSRGGHILCLDAETGQVAWSVYAPDTDELRWNVPRGGLCVSASPLIEKSLLILNLEIAAAALDKTTGKILWAETTATGGIASPVPFEMGGERCVALFARREVAGLSAATGQKLWSHPWPKGTDVPDPVAVGKNLFVASGNSIGATLLEPAHGAPAVLWFNELPSPAVTSPVVWEGHLYSFHGDFGKPNELICLDAATGDVKWRQAGLDTGFHIVVGGMLLSLSEHGLLLCVEATPAGYKELARAQVLGGKCWTLPAFSAGRIYCRNHDGTLVCLDVRGK